MQHPDRGQRAGVRRNESVQYGQPGQGRDSQEQHRTFDATRDQHDHRNDQHQTDFEEHRNADDGSDKRHLPRQHRSLAAAEQSVHHLVRATGIRQELAQHGAQRDQHADITQDAANPFLVRRSDITGGDTRCQAYEQRADGQRQEGVHLDDHDEQDDDRDADNGHDHDAGVVAVPRIVDVLWSGSCGELLSDLGQSPHIAQPSREFSGQPMNDGVSVHPMPPQPMPTRIAASSSAQACRPASRRPSRDAGWWWPCRTTRSEVLSRGAEIRAATVELPAGEHTDHVKTTSTIRVRAPCLPSDDQVIRQPGDQERPARRRSSTAVGGTQIPASSTRLPGHGMAATAEGRLVSRTLSL